MRTELRQFRRLAPLLTSCVVVATLVTCLVLTKTQHVYTGGLKWPYFSDMGRDAPGYYVFCVGLTVVAIMIACTWAFNYQFQRVMLSRPIQLGEIKRRTLRWATACAVVGMASVVGLPVLAFFSTTSYPKLHNSAAIYFFVLETIAVFINTGVTTTIYRHARARVGGQLSLLLSGSYAAPSAEDFKHFKRLRRTFVIQIVFTALFFVAFLLHLPIGLAFVQTPRHLTIVECLERDLGTAYCTKTMKLNATETKLWLYEGDLTWAQIRAAAQLGCILTLVGYSLSFLSHDYEGEEDGIALDHAEDDAQVSDFVAISLAKSASTQ